MITFEIMEKNKFDDYSSSIFKILAANMRVIAPTGNSMEEDHRCWLEAVSDGLKSVKRNIILIKEDAYLIGFFQYYLQNDLFMMEEIQFQKEWQTKSDLFRKLYGFLISILPSDIIKVEAYANKKNVKSQSILEHLGLLIDSENKNGNSFHYHGSFTDLKKWYYQVK